MWGSNPFTSFGQTPYGGTSTWSGGQQAPWMQQAGMWNPGAMGMGGMPSYGGMQSAFGNTMGYNNPWQFGPGSSSMSGLAGMLGQFNPGGFYGGFTPGGQSGAANIAQFYGQTKPMQMPQNYNPMAPYTGNNYAVRPPNSQPFMSSPNYQSQPGIPAQAQGPQSFAPAVPATNGTAFSQQELASGQFTPSSSTLPIPGITASMMGIPGNPGGDAAWDPTSQRWMLQGPKGQNKYWEDGKWVTPL